MRLPRRRRAWRSRADQRPRPALPPGRRRGRLRPPRPRRACCGWPAPTPSASTSAPPRRRPLDQDAICFLLAEKAREGKTVARLKWGDPFVFDSGGKEALFLHEQGMPFEVVPGIPAAIGGAGLCRRADHLSRRRRRRHVRPRPRGREPTRRRRRLGGLARLTARSSATPGAAAAGDDRGADRARPASETSRRR